MSQKFKRLYPSCLFSLSKDGCQKIKYCRSLPHRCSQYENQNYGRPVREVEVATRHLQLTSPPPCWMTGNKKSFVSSNMAATPLSTESLRIGCKRAQPRKAFLSYFELAIVLCRTFRRLSC